MANYDIKHLPPFGFNPALPSAQNAEVSYYQMLAAVEYKLNECIDALNTLKLINPVSKTAEMTSPVGVDNDGKLYAAPADLSAYATREYVDTEDAKKNDVIVAKKITLPFLSWVNNEMVVPVAGITEDTNLSAGAYEDGLSNSSLYNDAGVRVKALGNGTITFACETAPGVNLYAQIFVYNDKGETV